MMANKATQVPPMTQEERLAYAAKCRKFANELRETDPYSAWLNDWMASNYEKPLSDS